MKQAEKEREREREREKERERETADGRGRRALEPRRAEGGSKNGQSLTTRDHRDSAFARA